MVFAHAENKEEETGEETKPQVKDKIDIMPLKSFTCKICGAKCPKEYLAHGKFKERMEWLRSHRKRMRRL